MDKIYAIVVTYNRKKLLNRCLDALSKQTYAINKVIVIDNCSTDYTEEMVNDWIMSNPDWIHYQKLKENYGGAGGFYYGFKYVMKNNPDWVVVMDDDAAPEEEYIEKLMMASHQNQSVGCFIGTEYVGYTNRRAYGGRRRITDKNTLNEVAVNEEEYQKGNFYIDTIVFVGPMIRGDILKKVGCPDKEFFIYYDDTDYSMRLRKYTDILCIPAARINHRTDFENDVIVEGQKEWRRFYMYRNRLMIKKRYISRPSSRRKELLRCFYHELKDIWFPKGNQNGSLKKSFRSTYIVIRATIDVLRNKLGRVKYIRYEK